MFNEADMATLTHVLDELGLGNLVSQVAATLDAHGVTGLVHSNEPEESKENHTFFARVTVELEIRTPDPQTALDWANEHSVFDYLDRGATVGEVTIHDMNGENVTPASTV